MKFLLDSNSSKYNHWLAVFYLLLIVLFIWTSMQIFEFFLRVIPNYNLITLLFWCYIFNMELKFPYWILYFRDEPSNFIDNIDDVVNNFNHLTERELDLLLDDKKMGATASQGIKETPMTPPPEWMRMSPADLYFKRAKEGVST